MRQYIELAKDILDDGEYTPPDALGNRTGVGAYSVFGRQLRFDMREGFPLVTAKYTNFDAVKEELFWFLSGSTNVNDLRPKIWDEWADSDGNLGPIYGKQWRDWGGVDQIKQLLVGLLFAPHSRRHIVSAWNVTDLPSMALAPCHVMFQCYTRYRHLDLHLYQRSADVALGLPFNIASYSLLLSLLARAANLIPRYFIHSIGDAHIYESHVRGMKEVVKREPKPLPWLDIPPVRPGYMFRRRKVSLKGYQHHPAVRFEVVV